MTDTQNSSGLIKIVIKSVSTLHLADHGVMEDGLYFDLAETLKDPDQEPQLRERNGLDEAVQDYVLGSPGSMETVERIAEAARGTLLGYADRRHQVVIVIIGCPDGKHRSVVIAEQAAQYLRVGGLNVGVEHPHIDLPL